MCYIPVSASKGSSLLTQPYLSSTLTSDAGVVASSSVGSLNFAPSATTALADLRSRAAKDCQGAPGSGPGVAAVVVSAVAVVHGWGVEVLTGKECLLCSRMASFAFFIRSTYVGGPDERKGAMVGEIFALAERADASVHVNVERQRK